MWSGRKGMWKYKQKKSFCSRLAVGALAGTLLLGGCGIGGPIGAGNSSGGSEAGSETAAGQGTVSRQEIDYEALFREMENQDYLKGEWQVGKVQNPLFYRKIDKSDAELFEKENSKDQIFFHDTAAGKDVFYYVCSAFNEEESRSDEVLFVYDDTSQMRKQYKLRAPESEYTYINRMSASGGKLALFRQDSDEEGNTVGLFAHILSDDSLKSDENTEPFAEKILEEGVNLYPAMQEYIDIPLPHYVLGYEMEYEAFSDRFYLLSKETDKIITIQNDGTLGKIYEEEKAKFSFFVQTPEGLQLFQSYPHDGNPAEIFYLQDGEKKVLYQGEYIQSKMACIDSKGSVLYVAGDGQNLIEWRVLTGERRKIFSAVSECLKYPLGIIREENGDLSIFDSFGQMAGRKHIVGAGEAVEAVIRVKPTMDVDYNIRECLNNYAITHPGITIEFLEGGSWDERDITLNQMYSDITKGEGADMLVLTGEEMYALADKDCLLDLSEILEPENYQGIYEGILRNGYVGDKMYLLTMSASAECFYVKREAWDKPSWTLKEFMETVEKLDAVQPLRGAVCTSYAYLGPRMLLVELINNLEGEGFVNTKTGESFLNGEEFRKVLEFCKKYGGDNQPLGDMYSQNDSQKELLQGNCALLLSAGGSFMEFSHNHAYLGEDYRMVGLPGCGNGTLNGGKGIAVNKNTDYPELIADIVNMLYSPEYALASHGYMVPLSRDTLIGKVRDAADWSQGQAWVQLDSRTCEMVDAKPDGTSYLTEYLEYLDQIRPRPQDAELSPVRNIILEEAAAYFDGERSLNDVIDMMQSRVSLYLAEQL